MTPEQYRQHRQLGRAFFRGGDAARAGRPLEANPYRKVGVVYKARRRSWSEAYTLAWAAGWHHYHAQQRAVPGSPPAVTS